MQELADIQRPLYICIDIQKIKEIVLVKTLQEKFKSLEHKQICKSVIAYYGDRCIKYELMSLKDKHVSCVLRTQILVVDH